MTDMAAPAKSRIELLEQFLAACELWFAYAPSETSSAPSESEAKEAHRFINRNLIAAKSVLLESRIPNPDRVADLLDALGSADYVAPMLVTSVLNQAIGFYSHIDRNTGLIGNASIPQALDVEGAIYRALRLAFRNSPPINEKAVQDAIEVILRAIGVPCTREQETAPVGARAFRPDFALTPLDLALEVKLTNEKHGASAVQEEIAADITAFRTKWKRTLFVIYDCGAITDPLRHPLISYTRPKTSRKTGCSMTSWAKSSMSGRSSASRMLGRAW